MPTSFDDREPLSTALLLASTGGLLDAFTYLNHGHVFANTMTGNVVLLGLSLLHHSPHDALEHLVPLCAFLAGVITSRAMRHRLGPHASMAGLLLEAVALFIVGWLPLSLPRALFTASIAFAAAYQVAGFRHVDSFSYNSTFVTGNLRDMAEGVYEALAGPLEQRQAGTRKARGLGSICACFLLGVFAGAVLAPRFENHTVWFALPLLALSGAALHHARKAAATS